jgi:hypothetical protein
LTDETAPAKFLCAKVGFTQLCRRRYGAPAARRHEAGFSLPLPKNQKNLKKEKEIQVPETCASFFENLS